jgi:lysophospholipase L1-like esterase
MKIVLPAALIALLAVLVTPTGKSASAADCTRTSVGFTALPDLKAARYEGFQGGLYAGGRNAPSGAYLKQGLTAARRIKPIGGKVVVLSVGMSNTTQEFQAFKRLADADPRKSPSVLVVDGAQGGHDAERIKDPSARFWSVIDQRLAAAGATAAQVQAAWLKEAIARPTEAFPADARRLQGDLRAIVGIMKARYPNLRIVYLSSRTYAGYASTPLNPEPYAYQSGFAVKWTIQDRAAGRLKGRPWLAWGPYLWTDGTRGRKDGFTWQCSDTRADGTHPSESGRRKVAERLLRFFETDRTARSWFLR